MAAQCTKRKARHVAVSIYLCFQNLSTEYFSEEHNPREYRAGAGRVLSHAKETAEK